MFAVLSPPGHPSLQPPQEILRPTSLNLPFPSLQQPPLRYLSSLDRPLFARERSTDGDAQIDARR